MIKALLLTFVTINPTIYRMLIIVGNSIMSRIVKLLALSLLLTGCTSMHSDPHHKGHSNSSKASAHNAKHTAKHVHNVSRDIAGRASAVTRAADVVNPHTP